MEIPDRSEDNIPKLKIKRLDTSFIYNRWKKVKMEITNEGDAIAENITFKFSGYDDDISIRNPSEINKVEAKSSGKVEFYLKPNVKVEAKSSEIVEFYLKPNVFGEVPLEVEVIYKDHLNREYKFKETIILKVRGLEEIMLDIYNIIWEINTKL